MVRSKSPVQARLVERDHDHDQPQDREHVDLIDQLQSGHGPDFDGIYVTIDPSDDKEFTEIDQTDQIQVFKKLLLKVQLRRLGQIMLIISQQVT